MRGNGVHIDHDLKFAFISILFLWGSLTVSAQSGKLLFHHLRLEDGLSDLTIPWVYKDSRGFVWISSLRGVNRFDGTRVKNYLPVSGDSTSLHGFMVQSSFFEDDNADLWFCTYEAINRYDRKSDGFQSFQLPGHDGKPASGYHIFHLDKEGNLWLLMENDGVYIFNICSQLFHRVHQITDLPRRALAIENNDGRVESLLLYSTDIPGIIHMQIDEDLQFSEISNILHGSRPDLLIPQMIISDEKGLLWIAGRNELVTYDIHQNTFTHTPFPGILSIADYDASTLFISVDDAGLWEYDKAAKITKQKNLPEFNNNASLLSTKIDAITRDRDGVFWIASWGVGLSYTFPEKRKFKIHSPILISDPRSPKFNPNGFFDLGRDRLLASTQNGLYEVNREGNIIRQWEPSDEIARERFKSLFSVYVDVGKNIWLCTFAGLSVISSEDHTITHVTDRSNIMFYVMQLKDGRLIASRQSSGLFEIDYGRGQYVIKRINQNLDHEYMLIGQDQRGTIWVSEELQSVILLDPVLLRPIDTLPITGLVVSLIHSQATGTIWLAGADGVHEIDDKSYVLKASYNEKNLMPCEGISNMLMNEKGVLWLSCRNQIMAFNPADRTTQVFYQEDGLPVSSFTEKGAYQFSDGEMWFGSVSGITSFHPENIHSIETPAIPQITQLMINDNVPGRPLVCKKNKATNITEIEHLSFTYKENTLSFLVNSLEYSAPARNKIRYKMEGLESDWIETTNGKEIRYSNLPFRSLTFKVSAANSDGEFNSDIRSIKIDMKPPFYKTWWFIGLSILSLIALVVYIFYINFRRKLEVQAVRLRLYENLHDDVGSRLMAIVMSADALLQGDKSNTKLQNMVNISRSIVGNMRRLVWAIDPENENMTSLVQKIRHDKSQILDEKISFHLTVPPDLLEKVVPGEIRYQVSSIINESMNNISKYAQAQNVWIIFNILHGFLHVSIRDDGKGFNPEKTSNDKVQSTGYGMGNMQKRAARIKAKLTVDSHPGKGTNIELRIPF